MQAKKKLIIEKQQKYWREEVPIFTLYNEGLNEIFKEIDD